MFSTMFSAFDPFMIVWIVIIGLILVAMFVVPMFRNKKQQQQLNSLFDGLEPGDKIKTVGGVIGTIKEVNTTATGKEITIDSAGSSLVFDVQAVYQVLSKINSPSAASATPAGTIETKESKEELKDVSTEDLEKKIK